MISKKLGTTRLAQLKALLEILANAIDAGPGARDLSQLAKQYRETLKDIEDIEGEAKPNDQISDILDQRRAAGQPGAVRKSRARISDD